MKLTIKDRCRHYLNPLHVICRLVDCGISVRVSKKLGCWYESHIYHYTFLA